MTAPLVFVENNYIVPTPYSCRFLGVVRSRPRCPPLVFVEYNYIVPTPYSCRFLGVVRSRSRWPPCVYRIQLHCTDTLQLQVLGSGTITATTAPLVFVEYNYIVPTPYSAGSWEWYDQGHDGTPRVCRIQLHCTDTLQLQVLGSGIITATTAPSCLQNTTTLYRHLTAAGSWEWYDHGHDGPPRVCRIQLHCTDTIQRRFLGVVRSRPRRHPSCLQNTTTLYRHLTAAGSWEWYDQGHDGTPRVCRIQLHCTDTLQLQVLGSGTITASTAPLLFVEYHYIVPTLYSCRFLGVVRSRPQRPPRVCRIQLHCTDTTPYSCRFLGVVRSRPRWLPRVCRIQLHCTDTLQLHVLGSGTITTTMAPSCLQNTTTLYRHLTAAGSWKWYDHGHDGPPRVCRKQLHCTDTLQLQILGSGTITATMPPPPRVCRIQLHCTDTLQLQVLGSGTITITMAPLCLQNTTTLYRHFTAAGSWEWYDHGHDGPSRVCRIQLHCTDTIQCRFLGVVRSRPRRHPSCLQNTTTVYRHLTAAGSWEWYNHGHDGPLVFVEYNYIVPTPYSCRFLGVVRSRPRRPPWCLQNTTTLYRHLIAAGSQEWYDHGHDGPPRVCRIQLHCTDTIQRRFLGVVRSRPRRHPSCLQNTTTLYRHLTAAGSWEWYDHGHDGPPRVCRIQLHCTDTIQCRFLGVVRSRPRRHPSCLQNTTTLYRHLTAVGSWEWYDHGHDDPLVFVENNYIVPTPYRCRFLGVVRSRPRRPPSCLQNTTTLYRHLTAAGSWEWYDHGHDGPLVFVEYNYIVPTPYSCRFLGVVRSRPRRPPSCLQNTTTLYRHLIAAGSWEWYDHGHDGPPRVCRIQLHCTDTIQCRFLGVVRSRPRRHPSCLQNTTTLYRHLTAAGSWEWYDHGHDGPPRVCRIQLHCTDTIQCRFLGVVRSRPRRHPSCLQNTTTLYRHLKAAGSWEWYDHGLDGPPLVCRIQLHCTDTLQLQVLGSGTITTTMAPSCLQNTTTLYRHLTAAGSWEWYDHDHDGPLVFIEYNYIVPTPYSCRFLGVVRSRSQRSPSCLQNTTTLYRHYTLQLQVLGSGTITTTMAPSCLQNTTTLYRHFTAACSWEWYDHDHDGPLVFIEYNYIVPTPYSCRFLEVVRSRPRRPPSCLQNTTTLYRHLIAAGSWEWYDHGHDGPPRVCRIQLHCTDTIQCRFLGVVRSRPRRHPSCLQNTTTLYRHLTAAGSWEWYDHGHDGPPRVCRIQLHCTDTIQCRFLGVVRSRPRRHLSCLQNTTTLYRHLKAAGSWEWYDHGLDGPPLVCRIQLHCTDTLQLQVLGSGTITTTMAPSCLQNTTTLYRHLTAAGSWEWYDHDHDGPLVFIEYNYIVPTPYSCRFLGVVRSRPQRPPSCLQNTTTLYRHYTLQLQVLGSGTITTTMAPSCLQNTTTLYRHFTAACSWEWYDHDHDGPLVFIEYNYIVPTPYSCRFLEVVRSRPRRPPSCLQNTTTLCRHYTLQLQVLGSGTITATTTPPPPSCLQNTTTLYRHHTVQVLGSGTIKATTAPLVFVEYNYIVPTP